MDHLRQQLRGMHLGPEDAGLVEILISSLDEEGYLADTLEEIAERVSGGDQDLHDELLERLPCALRWLQSLDPIGVGASDLSECLALQLRAMPRCEEQTIAIVIGITLSTHASLRTLGARPLC